MFWGWFGCLWFRGGLKVVWGVLGVVWVFPPTLTGRIIKKKIFPFEVNLPFIG